MSDRYGERQKEMSDLRSFIYLNELIIGNELGRGASGVVYDSQLDGIQYAYKEITSDDDFKSFVQPRLEKVADFYGDSSFVFPYKFVYKHPEDKLVSGYIMDYINGYDKLDDLQINNEEKIRILSMARKLLDKLHNDYKHVHTDSNPWNFVYNKNLDKVMLIDFDTCIDLDKKNMIDTSRLNTLSKIYCTNNACDEGIDIFLFNLLTFAILNNVGFYDVINHIIDGEYGCLNSFGPMEILSEYEDIYSNTLKKEYVIDRL